MGQLLGAIFIYDRARRATRPARSRGLRGYHRQTMGQLLGPDHSGRGARRAPPDRGACAATTGKLWGSGSAPTYGAAKMLTSVTLLKVVAVLPWPRYRTQRAGTSAKS
jgi:hypothetical protein